MKKHSKKIGLSPGALVHVGEKKVEKTTLSLIAYDHERFERHEFIDFEEVLKRKEEGCVNWVTITGIDDVDILEKVGKHYGIHALAIEDVLNTEHRPKVEFFEDYIFIVLKIINKNIISEELDVNQISLILGKDYVITFQQKQEDIFKPLVERIVKRRGYIRDRQSDYLAYAIIDVVVDNYFLLLEEMDESIQELEIKIINDEDDSVVDSILHFKKKMLTLMKYIWPLREELGALTRESNELIQDNTMPFLRDVYDHTIEIIDTTEILKETASNLLEIYLTSNSNKLNQVVKVLTIISTIFIPLTFITGIYGMNFEHIPELAWSWGYLAVWGLCLIISIAMIIFFRRKKWF